MKKQVYGWKKDRLDPRDLKFARPRLVEFRTVQLGDTYVIAPIVDQGQLGSCTANAIGGIFGFDMLNKHAQGDELWFQPSRLFIYFNERTLEGTVQWDAGAEIRDGIKSVANMGVCDELIWPYNIKQFRKKPPQKAYNAALNYQAMEYRRLDNTDKGALVTALYEGFPFVFGFLVYESFESAQVAKTGVVPMPKSTEKILGGHAVYCIGYDLDSDRFTCVNSWGSSWGNKGKFTIPAAYLTDAALASDFWVINLIE